MSMTDQDQAAFEALAKELESDKGGVVKYLRKGDNRIKLLVEQGRSKVNFAEKTFSMFNGKPQPKYLMFALVYALGDLVNETEEEIMQVRPVLVPKKVYQSIVNIAAKGYSLFDPVDSFGVIITKSGSNLQTSYEILPSPKPITLDPAKIVWPEKSLATFAKEYAEYQANRGNPGQQGPPQAEASLAEPEANASGW